MTHLQNNQYLLWPLAAAFGLIAVQTLVSGWVAFLLAAGGGFYLYKRYEGRIVPPEVAEAAAKEQTAAAVRELGLDMTEFEEDKAAAAKRKAAEQEARRAARKAQEAALAAGAAALEAVSASKGSASKTKGKGKAAASGANDDVDDETLALMASMVKAGSRSAARTIDTAKLLSPRSTASSGPASGKGSKGGKAAAAAAAAAASESESDAAAAAPAPSRSSGGARRRGKGGAAAGDEDGWTQQ